MSTNECEKKIDEMLKIIFNAPDEKSCQKAATLLFSFYTSIPKDKQPSALAYIEGARRANQIKKGRMSI